VLISDATYRPIPHATRQNSGVTIPFPNVGLTAQIAVDTFGLTLLPQLVAVQSESPLNSENSFESLLRQAERINSLICVP
jgi:hypothetical protein